MKALIARNGRFVGGLLGIAAAVALYAEYKLVGAAMAVSAVALAVGSEYLRSRR